MGSDSVNTLFTIGLTQDNAIQLLGEGDGLTTYPSLWKSYFDSSLAAVSEINRPTRKVIITNKVITGDLLLQRL